MGLPLRGVHRRRVKTILRTLVVLPVEIKRIYKILSILHANLSQCMTVPLPASSSTHQGTRDPPSTSKDVATGELGEEDVAAPAALGTLCPHVKGIGRCVAFCFKLWDSCLLAVLTHHCP